MIIAAKIIIAAIVCCGCIFVSPQPVHSATKANMTQLLLKGSQRAREQRATRIEWKMAQLRARAGGLEPIER